MMSAKTYKRVNERVTELDYLDRDSGYQNDRYPSTPFSPDYSDGSYPRNAQDKDNGQMSRTSFGVPGRKPYLDMMDLLAFLLALACFVVAICAISTRLSLAWHLGYTSQLIVIGFLLSIMNLALNRTLTALFFTMEARFGPSTLQNYEALLRKQPLATTRISTTWRVIMTLFVALPLGLSAGYKRYFGGTTTASVSTSDIPSHMYGAVALPGLNGLGWGADTAILVNSSLPFLVAAANDTNLPANFSGYYGQNVYMISNTSAAVLDLPMPELVSDIQHSLLGTFNKKTLSAKVHAFVTKYNVSAERDRDDPAYWNYYLSMPYADYTSVALFVDQWVVYTYMNQFGATDGTWMFVAMCEGADKFNSTALRFDTYRYACDATWDITDRSMDLIYASCEEDPLPDQTMLIEQTAAINYWYGAVLADNIGAFAFQRPSSGWRMPSYVVSVASMYWARYTGFAGPGGDSSRRTYSNGTEHEYELYYSVPDHTMSFTKACIDPQWSLIAILAAQPVLIVIVLILKAALHATPVGEGFGLVTILAGLNTKNLGSLKGASLTGNLREPVRLAINVVDKTEYDSPNEQSGLGIMSSGSRHVGFTVHSHEGNGTLLRGKKYQ